MPAQTPNDPSRTKRKPLTRASVISAAMTLADESGIAPLTIRRLATQLGVKPMAIYHHVANKDQILDAMVDSVFAEIDLPDKSQSWQEGMRARAQSARIVFARHPWAAAMMDSRPNPGPATLAHHDAVLACLRSGLSLPMAAHAYALLDAYVFGFALQEAALPIQNEADIAELAADILATFPRDAYPHLAELTIDHVLQPGYTFGAEFDFGLDLILDGLAAKALRAA